MTDPPKRPRGRPKTFDREQVLEVAVDCYWRRGPDGVSLNGLCRRAGVSKPVMYREFGGEDGVMAAALEHYAATVLGPVLAHTQADVAFGEALETILARLTHSDEHTPPGCLFTRLRSAAGRLGPKTEVAVAAMKEAALGAYSGWVDRAKARGELDPAVPTETVARFIDMQFTAVLAQMAAGDDPERLRAQARLAFSGLLVAADS